MSQESMSGLESMGGGAAPGGSITLAQAYAAGAALSDSALTLDATRGGLVLDATALTGAVFDVKVSGVSKFSVTEVGNLRTAGAVRLDGLGATGLVKNTNGGNLSIAVGGTDYEVPLTFATSDGLSRTVNAIKNTLITGLAGGQTITGGTASGENLTLTSTSNATKGKIYIGSALTVWVDGVNGNSRLNVDGTGLTTTTPVLVKNGKALSGIELQVTSTITTGFVINDSSGARKAAFALANTTDDWLVGSTANDTIVEVAASKRFLVGNNGGRTIFGVLPTTGGEVRVYDSASTAKYATISANITGSGELPNGTYISTAGTSMDISITPEANGTAGRKLAICYYRNTGWSSALEIAHTSGGSFGNLLLMKGGGSVGIGVTGTPANKLEINTGGLCFTGTQTFSGSNSGMYGSTSALGTQVAGNTAWTIASSDMAFKWAGNSFVTSSAALSTSATVGFLYIPTCAGTPTGVPVSQTGTVALVYDTTNDKLYIYRGGWKGGTAPGVWS